MTGSRDIEPATVAAAAASVIHPVLLAKLEFDGGDVLVHSELGDLEFAGDTYTGVGILGGVGTAEEASDLSNSPITLSLSGIPNDVAAVLLAEQYQGRRATIYLGYLDLETRALVDDPAILYRGLIDTADLQQDKSFSISLSVGSRFAAWDAPLVRRYNDSDQQGRYPGDRGLEFIEQAAQTSIFWGIPSQ